VITVQGLETGDPGLILVSDETVYHQILMSYDPDIKFRRSTHGIVSLWGLQEKGNVEAHGSIG